jgi:hypothetical protein
MRARSVLGPERTPQEKTMRKRVNTLRLNRETLQPLALDEKTVNDAGGGASAIPTNLSCPPCPPG